MGKRSKQLKNKLRGGRRLRKPKLHGPCFFEGCNAKAYQTHHCMTCEQLVAAGKAEKVVTVTFCPAHEGEATAEIRKHAVIGHPLPNVPRAIIAGLKGDL
jgi:hypothetical protein